MGKSLYRAYRSKTFDEIIGQDHITTVLKNALESESVSHAYLLSGPRGVGKTSTARVLAHAVNQIEYTGENLNLDIIEIDAASNRRIDEIREIRDKINIAPVSGKYKVYIIDEVHMLTKEAFNALLKTLEEPPAHVIFILATTEKHKVPETILSRCVKLNFKPIGDKVIAQHLRKLAKVEKIIITDEALSMVSEHANGSFRDAISLLEQVKFISKKIDVNDVNLMLGLAPDSLINNIIDCLINPDLPKLVKNLEKASEDGVNDSVLSSQLSKHLRKLLIIKNSNLETSLVTDLLSGLLLVPGSPNPRIQLEIVLTNIILKKSDNHETLPLETEITPNIDKTVPLKDIATEESASAKIKTQKKESPDSSNTDTTQASEASKEDDDVWLQFLNELKVKNNTLYGIARMAQPDIHGNMFNLTFTFAFHHKQAMEPKNQKIFYDVLISIGKPEVNIKCHLLSKQHITSKKNETKPDLSTISNIFGGHEVLES